MWSIFQEIPHEGAFGDIVWSDPEDIESWAAKASMIGLCRSNRYPI